MNKLPELTTLNKYLSLDGVSGVITVKEKRSNRCKIGSVATTKHKSGYLTLKIGGKSYYAHRVVWKMFYGVEPKGQIDHINGNRVDNRKDNLREVTAKSNAQNRLSLGYTYIEKIGKYRSTIMEEGSSKDLGYFRCETAARLVYLSEKVKLGHIEIERLFNGDY